MKYKNKTSILILLFLLIASFGVIAYLDSRIEYKLFVVIVTFFSSIFYIFALFEYYKVDENKLIHVNKLGLQKKEVFWKDINSIYIYPDKYFKAIRISYGTLNEIVINTGVKNYKELIKIILHKTKNNLNISIDKRVDDFIK